MKLKSESLYQIKALVFNFAKKEGVSKEETNQALKDFEKGDFTSPGVFLIWDALGQDYLGLVAKNPDLQKVFLVLGSYVMDQTKSLIELKDLPSPSPYIH